MILYHGSNQVVQSIDLAKSRPGKDFGQAFYLSDSESQASEMAEFKVSTFGGEVIVNRFEFAEEELRTGDIRLLRFEAYTEGWARFILANRSAKAGEHLHDYDIVYGPIANDRIGRQIFNFQSGYIDFKTFVKRIQYPEGITFQWAFCTPKAIKLLQHL